MNAQRKDIRDGMGCGVSCNHERHLEAFVSHG